LLLTYPLDKLVLLQKNILKGRRLVATLRIMLLEQTGRSCAETGEEGKASLFESRARLAKKQSRRLRQRLLTSERFSVDSLIDEARVRHNT
jgi:hypothetical protein